MDWFSEHWMALIGPAVIAAAISSIVTVIGFFITTSAAKQMHREKLNFDKCLAERKFEFDKDLAERKFRYDRDLHDHKRRIEIAEEVLADFYKAREIIAVARSPGGFGDEGATRQKEPWETAEDTQTLNAYFRTIERLSNQADFFSQFLARQHRFQALFGSHAGQPFPDLWRIRGEILIAARSLITTHQQRNIGGKLPAARATWEATIGWVPTQDDEIANRLAGIIEEIERICRPVIQDGAT